jgi:hypothetical protein
MKKVRFLILKKNLKCTKQKYVFSEETFIKTAHLKTIIEVTSLTVLNEKLTAKDKFAFNMTKWGLNISP